MKRCVAFCGNCMCHMKTFCFIILGLYGEVCDGTESERMEVS